jgi:hypothetical protein
MKAKAITPEQYLRNYKAKIEMVAHYKEAHSILREHYRRLLHHHYAVNERLYRIYYPSYKTERSIIRAICKGRLTEKSWLKIKRILHKHFVKGRDHNGNV